jgi:glutamyl-tRNA synthetase
MVENSRFFYEDTVVYDEQAVKKHIKAGTDVILVSVRDRLVGLEAWLADGIHHAIEETVSEHSVGFPKVAQPLRIAVTGSTTSPSIDTTLDLLGRDKTLERIDKLLEYIEKR